MCGPDNPGIHAFHKRFGITITVLSDIALQVFTKALCSSWCPEASCPMLVIKTGAAYSSERRASVGIIYSFKCLCRHASHLLPMLVHAGATSSEFLCSLPPTPSLCSIHTDSFLLPSSSITPPGTPLFLTAKTKSYPSITTSSGPLKLTLGSGVVAMIFIYLSSGVSPISKSLVTL